MDNLEQILRNFADYDTDEDSEYELMSNGAVIRVKGRSTTTYATATQALGAALTLVANLKATGHEVVNRAEVGAEQNNDWPGWRAVLNVVFAPIDRLDEDHYPLGGLE